MSFLRENYIATKKDGEYTITSLNEGVSVAYWAESPDGFSDDHIVGEFTDTITFKDPARGIRLYFHILCGGRYFVAATRSVSAGGMRNLRDIGGYNTADGKSFVRYGRIYRSDMLRLCGDENIPELERLKLKKIIDFRSRFDLTTENGIYADPPVRGASYEWLPVYDDNDPRLSFTFESIMKAGRSAIVEAYELILSMYKTTVFDSAAYRKMFADLVCGRTPMLFHCYAGKDRTGVAAALILLCLGVPRETIIYDYMLTAETRKGFYNQRMEQFAEYITDDELKKIATFFTLVDSEAIESSLDAIAERYPDTDRYFTEEMGLTEQELKELRATYLEQH